MTDASLTRAFMPPHCKNPFTLVFCAPTLYSFSPSFPAAIFQFRSHEDDNLFFCQRKLKKDRIKRCSIFPGHFNYSVYFPCFHVNKTKVYLKCLNRVKTLKKENFPRKICKCCHKEFNWRKKWKRCWNEVLYCSERCRRSNKAIE